MSILMKKPRIEEIADALGDAKKTLLGVLDGPGEYARFDLEKGPLPVGGAPLVRRSILSYKGREYPGVYLRTSLGSHFIEVSGKEECATYEVDEAHRSLRKVDEPLTAEELRRVLGGGSGGGSGLPDGYFVDDAGNVTIAGAITANNNGDVEVGKNLNVDGMATFGGGKNAIYQKTKIENLGGTELSSTMGFLLLSGVGLSAGGQTMLSNGPACLFLFNEEGAGDGATAKIGVPRNASGEIISSIAADDFSPYATFGTARRIVIANEDDQLQENVIYVDNLTSKSAVPAIDAKFCLSDNPTVSLAKLATASQAKYQHTVILSGGGFEFCFTAPSSKNLVVDSYQDLGVVFGGERIGLIGYSSSLSAKPVFIDLHGGSESNDFIRVFEENGNTFANHTLSSLGAITFSDDVYPN